MSALLVYRNATPEVMAWAEDLKQRTDAVVTERLAWMAALYDAHGVPDDEDSRAAFTRGRGVEFTGLRWPKDMALPDGWFRPVKTPELIRPRSNTKAGKAALKDMARFHRPDAPHELSERFGMADYVFAGRYLYRAGVSLQDDGVWVTWGDREVADQLGDVESHGWVRVLLVEYIERFGEDAL